MRFRTFSPASVPWRDMTRLGVPPLWGSVAMVVLALLLWLVGTPAVDLRQMDDTGIVSVLRPAHFGALALLAVSFCLALRAKPLRPVLLGAHVVVLVFMLYGITAMLQDVPRFGVVWIHIGFTELIARTGDVAPGIGVDARFNWPGLFVLAAFITQLAGLESVQPLMGWAPVFFNLIYIGPLLIILRALTDDERLVWLGIWLFYLTNWIGQDYFSPQALNYFLYLTILGLLLRYFKAPSPFPRLSPRWQARLGPLGRPFGWAYGWLTDDAHPNVSSTPWERAGLVFLLVVLFAAMVPSHPLTPYFTLASVMALVFSGRCSVRSLPVVMGVFLAVWVGYMMVEFLRHQSSMITDGAGKVGGTVGANVTDRLKGSDGHLLVLRLRLVMTLAIWGLAFLGGLLRVWKGRRDTTVLLLAGTPFPLMLVQSYGGEMMLRVYLFALPFMAFFAAALFFPLATARSNLLRSGVLLGLSGLLMTGFLFTRYGNERMDTMTGYEQEAVEYVYGVAQPKALFLAAVPNLPWRYKYIERYTFNSVQSAFLAEDYPAILKRLESKQDVGAYFILTHSQQAYSEVFLGMQPGMWEERIQALWATGRFERVFQNRDAEVWRLKSSTPAAAQPTTPTPAPARPATPLPTAQPAATPLPNQPSVLVYTVQPGDTVADLAWRYRTTVAAIRALNPRLDPAQIEVGDQIRIPLSADQPTPTLVPDVDDLGYVAYVVRRGDTLALIAARYDTSVAALMAINPGINPNRIEVGDVIRIPDGPLLTPTAGPAGTAGGG